MSRARAEQAMDGLSRVLAGQVPEREVDHGEDAVMQGGQVEALALFERLPKAFAVERVLADEDGLDQRSPACRGRWCRRPDR